MLDIAFSRSAAGTIAFCDENKIFYSGKKNDIICLPDDMSQGDISGAGRCEALSKFYFPLSSKYFEADAEEHSKNTDKLLARLSEGEDMCIFYSRQPNEYCGFLRLCSDIFSRKVSVLPRITAVKLKELLKKNNCAVRQFGWGEVLPEDFYSSAENRYELTAALISAAAMKWEMLKKENSALRAFVNGDIKSVNEDFYDFFIKAELDNMPEEFEEAELVGSIISRRLGIGDMLIALRIEKMIDRGDLISVSEAQEGSIYRGRKIRKVKNRRFL